MECPECKENMTAYGDGELAAPSIRAIDAHLRDCPDCARELDSLNQSARFMDTHLPRHEEPSPALWSAIEARLSSAPAGEAGAVGFRYRWVAAVAATLVLSVGLWGYLERRSSEQELISYMNQYVSVREEMESEHAARRPPSLLHETENPFVLVAHEVPVFGNPAQRQE